MNFKSDLSSFQAELACIAGSVETKATMPQCGLMHLETKAGSVIITANNMDFGLRAKVTAEIKTEGLLVVNYSKVHSWMGKTNGNELTFSATKTRAAFKVGKSQIGIAQAEVGNFPPFPKPEDKVAKINAKQLGTVLSGIVFVIANFEDPRFNYAGAMLEITDKQSPEFGILAVATDGNRLAVSFSAPEGEYLQSLKCVISRKAASELIKLCSRAEGAVEISVSKGSVFFNFGNRLMFCRRLSENLPNYKKILPDPATQHSAIVDSSDTIDAISRVATLCEDSKRIIVAASQGKLSFSNQSSLGESEDFVEAEYQGPDIIFAINAQWLIEALRAVSGKVRISFEESERKPVEIGRVGTFEYRSIIMKMK